MYKKKSTKQKLSIRQQLVILALILVLPASALMVAFMQSKHNAKIATSPKLEMSQALNKAATQGVKSRLQEAYNEIALQRGHLSEDELALYEYYQSDEFANAFENFFAKGDVEGALNFMFEKMNAYLEGHYLDYENSAERGIQTRDWFAGITKSRDECVNLWNSLYSIIENIFTTAYNILDMVDTVWGIIMASPLAGLATAAVGAIMATLKSVLAAIPVVGWIALALIAAVEATILVTMLVAGSKNKGFKVGVNVKTKFKIPYGVNWVCTWI